MEKSTPPAIEPPRIEAPPYDTASFVCTCGEALWDHPEDDQWTGGHQFECDHCGRAYRLSFECLQDATNHYPHCIQCDTVLHAHRGREDSPDFYVCPTCSYQVPKTDDEQQFRRWILAHEVYMQICNRRAEMDTEYRHVDPDSYPGVWMFLDDDFRDALQFDKADDLPPSEGWIDSQIERLLDDGIIETE